MINYNFSFSSEISSFFEKTGLVCQWQASFFVRKSQNHLPKENLYVFYHKRDGRSVLLLQSK
ncbi:hypothetical protein HMPREF0262_00241 [Clostridium sp. ATCC 29733]|nr:hypothetical protein HMPREF0262_00241 [Clostridium sp. ATCC 29733]